MNHCLEINMGNECQGGREFKQNAGHKSYESMKVTSERITLINKFKTGAIIGISLWSCAEQMAQPGVLQVTIQIPVCGALGTVIIDDEPDNWSFHGGEACKIVPNNRYGQDW